MAGSIVTKLVSSPAIGTPAKAEGFVSADSTGNLALTSGI